MIAGRPDKAGIFDFAAAHHEETLLSGERLTGSDKRALLVWVMLGIVGALFARHYFFRAFPEASVDFRVSRDEALARAQRFASSLGEDVSSYKSAITFDMDDDAKTYLERELGLQQANRMMSSELNIWYWDVRFFKPQQEEEFHVRVSPGGEVVGYDHKVPEARAGPSLARNEAEAMARNFLSGKLGVDLNIWDFLPEEANSEKKPKRLDWSFTWEKHGFRAKDAPYRLQVAIHGDRVGSTQQYLQVPEAWTRSYKRLRSANDTLALVFTVPYLILLGTAVWLAIRLTNRGQTSWRGAILLGAVVATLLFLQNLNGWPLWGASYDTNASYGSFLALKVGTALLTSVATAITITLVLPAGEPLYRASQPNRLQLSKTFTWRGLRSKEFFSSAVVGLSMVRSRVLHSGKPFRCLGAAGIELRGIGEYRVSLDIRRGDWIACFYERRIYFSPICDSFFRPAHAFPLDCSDRAGVFVELSAQQLPSRTAVHSRHRDRLVRHSRRDCYAALGYSCDPHLALHRGCVSGGLVPASFE